MDKYNKFGVLKNDDSNTILVFSVQVYLGVSLHMHYQHKSGPFLIFSFHNFEDHNYSDAAWCSVKGGRRGGATGAMAPL